MTESNHDTAAEKLESPGRRELLAKAGRFAGATPAAVLVLLSTSKDAGATGIFRSGGGGPKGNRHGMLRRKRMRLRRQRLRLRRRRLRLRRNWD